MSRSRKKHNVVKDKGCKTYNRSFRRINKQRLHIGKEPIQLSEAVNDYDVCDYWFFTDNEKYMRK